MPSKEIGEFTMTGSKMTEEYSTSGGCEIFFEEESEDSSKESGEFTMTGSKMTKENSTNGGFEIFFDEESEDSSRKILNMINPISLMKEKEVLIIKKKNLDKTEHVLDLN